MTTSIHTRTASEQVGTFIAEENAILFGVPRERELTASVLRARAARLGDEDGSDADWINLGDLLRQPYRELYAVIPDREPATPK